MSEVISTTPSAHRIIGGVGTGKTELLIQKVTQALQNGISTQALCVFCATPSAAAVFKQRLTAAGAPEDIRITTTQEYALELLASSEARAFTGRNPSLPAHFEINFLLEDMKVTGLRPKRLKEMLKFFYRSWTELADENPEWLLPGEETNVHAYLKEELDFLDCITEPELCGFAFRYLKEDAAALQKKAYSHVFVDDYQHLNRASQALTNLIAQESITIAGNPTACFEVFDSYPYEKGLEEFLTSNSHAKTDVLEKGLLPQAVVTAVNNLLEDESLGAPLLTKDATASLGEVSTREFTSAKDEFEGIANLAAEALNAGTPTSEIFIVSPHAAWLKKIQSALEEKGIAQETLLSPRFFKGDFREYEKCGALRAYTALKLAANPHDNLAWRCWCGYGDYLAHSTAFHALRQEAHERDLSLYESLKALSEEAFTVPGGEKILPSFRAGHALIEKLSALQGTELIQALAAFTSVKNSTQTIALLEKLCGALTENDNPEDLLQKASNTLFFSRFSLSENRVKIAEAKDLCGLSPSLLIYSGFVNGFVPPRNYFDLASLPLEKQKKMHVEILQLLAATLGKSQGAAIFTYFIRADLENAERLGLEIERIRIEKGKRTCIIAPSIFLETIEKPSS